MLGLMDPEIFEHPEPATRKTNATITSHREEVLNTLEGINKHGSSAFFQGTPERHSVRGKVIPVLRVEDLRQGDIINMLDKSGTARPFQFEVIGRAWVDNIVTVKSTGDDESKYKISGSNCFEDGTVDLIPQHGDPLSLCINSINRNK